jgi:DNA topoisomerase-1
MSKSLVIVESPAKARTISGYLGDDFVVESSIGHIRDLPKGKDSTPAEIRGKFWWDYLAVDVENDFQAHYVVSPDKKSHITKLKALLKDADILYLATDEDREGEAIAWHLLEVLKPKVPVKRMVFHEITPKAIQSALQAPRDIDRRLVDAQETRRILDRLYGYDVSPVLWKKVLPGLSAGRVQSVAVRLIVERERARRAFVSARYWDIEAELSKTVEGTGPMPFKAMLHTIDGQRLAGSKDFGPDGLPKTDKVRVLDEAGARALAAGLESVPFTVTGVERKPYSRSPAAPFMTSTLQQDAGRKLRFSADRTMRAAQRLYENGYITYMRTDSTNLSEAALTAARTEINTLYGPSYVPAKPRVYRKKVKNAQEAHEAIRPAGDAFRHPKEVADEVGPDEARLYELIWKRTLASQMEDARGETMRVTMEASAATGEQAVFNVRGNTITFPGFLRAYVEGSDDPEEQLENRERHLPPLAEGETVKPNTLTPNGHETQPPPRFTEASLVQQLEKLGVGRPSTYASIIKTVVDREYVWKKGGALVPSIRAMVVVGLLERHFSGLVDYAFTARMEEALDAIASGDAEAAPWLRRFYWGDPQEQEDGLRPMVTERLGDIDARSINTLPIGDDEDGKPIVARLGRFGPYLEKDGQRANIPSDLPPDQLDLQVARELLASEQKSERELGLDPATGGKVIAKTGPYGAYVQLGEVAEEEGDGKKKKKKKKPPRASLFKSMSIDTVTLQDALRLLSLPRTVGVGDDGVAVTAQNGRYGPYVQKGTERRSLQEEAQLFTVTLAEAEKLLAEPKRGRGQRATAAEPLRTLDNDPVSGNQITVREGRYGPYVTDGETSASLRKTDAVDSITTERAAELIQARRDRGPGKKKRRSSGGRRKGAGGSASKAAT